MRPDLEHDYTQYVAARLPRLHRIAYQLLGDRHRADDAVQDALTSLYQHWPRVHEVHNLDAYVHTMVVRAVLSDRRRFWARVQLWGSPPEPAGPPHPPDEPGVEQRMVLRQALRALPEGQRTVLVLRFLCDLPVEEVAAVLSRSEGTVKSQTSHGLRALRRLLDVSEFSALRDGAA
ncbi:SigE family RNA polymerase sigma factor [Dactylosporangium sp. NPDC048998]|uniref:SigE family RNA polymerase sigma factor n=1 Tax=Dactylosporangium sp. NPDC048998 TaxID=3363976 RepID=UPI00371881ED